MTLSGFVLFMLGLLAELVLLFEGSSPGLAAADRGARSLIDRTLGPSRQVIAILAVIAGLLIGLFELLRVGGVLVYIDSPVVGFIFVVLGVAVFFAAMMADLFLPVVNEQSILIVQALVLVSALWGGGRLDWLPLAILAGIPALVSLGLVLWRWSFPPWAKALLYLWYLLSLMIPPFQSGQAGFFRAARLTWSESLSFGMLFIFLIIHGLFAARFFLMVSSLLYPRNYKWIRQIMPRLFSDEQVSMPRFGLAALLVAGLLLLNQWLGLLERSTAVSLAMLLAVQVLSRRSPPQDVRSISSRV